MPRKLLYSAIALALAPVAYAQAAVPTVAANALPTNGSVIVGTASAVLSGDTMTINAGNSPNSDLTAIVWGNQGGAAVNPGATGGFNVGSAATVIFKSTLGTANVLNIDISGNPSVLDGKLVLNSNDVLIANGNGIFVGSQANINISGLNQGGLGEFGLIADSINTAASILNVVGAHLFFNVLDGQHASVGDLAIGSGSVTIAPGAFIGNHNSSDQPTVLIAGSDVNIDGSINAGQNIDFLPTNMQNTLNIGSTGSVGSGNNINILPGTDTTTQNQYLSIEDNGIIGAQSTMSIGGAGLLIGNITGAGLLAVNRLTINNLVGSINNITSSQILANGFQIDTIPSKDDRIIVDAVGSKPQGINLKINGSAYFSTGDTYAVLANGEPPANANSKLVIQATGDLGVGSALGNELPNPYSPSYSSFQFPGLIYLESYQNIDVEGTDIVNAYTTDAPVGYGIFLIAPQIDELYPVYANGGRGVVFAAPFNGAYYPTAEVNGTDQNFGMPSVYFLGNNGPTMSSTFINENNNSQEEDTFYTFTPNS